MTGTTLITYLRKQPVYDLVVRTLRGKDRLLELVDKAVSGSPNRDWKNYAVNVMSNPVAKRLPVLLVFDGSDSFEAYWNSLEDGLPRWCPFHYANRKPYRQLMETAVPLNFRPEANTFPLSLETRDHTHEKFQPKR